MPRTQNFFTSIHFGRGTVIHRRLREAFKTLPRHRMNNCGNRIRNEAGFWVEKCGFVEKFMSLAASIGNEWTFSAAELNLGKAMRVLEFERRIIEGIAQRIA